MCMLIFLSGLPDLAVQLQAAISSLGKVSRPSHSVLAIPATPRKTPTALKLPVTPPSTTPEKVLSDSADSEVCEYHSHMMNIHIETSQQSRGNFKLKAFSIKINIFQILQAIEMRFLTS